MESLCSATSLNPWNSAILRRTERCLGKGKKKKRMSRWPNEEHLAGPRHLLSSAQRRAPELPPPPPPRRAPEARPPQPARSSRRFFEDKRGSGEPLTADARAFGEPAVCAPSVGPPPAEAAE
ncbi:uncharacterized protein [Ciconia boyciana]|uniref:uncharacterized protein n=1 Tax=Ciconia boyciana TaxID=52775 RepID=UPI003BA3592A